MNQLEKNRRDADMDTAVETVACILYFLDTILTNISTDDVFINPTDRDGLAYLLQLMYKQLEPFR